MRPEAPADAPLLTIFSAPKAFKGHVGIIQENAIRSWLSLSPKPKVILFCNEDGATEVIRGLSVELVSDIETNAFGTPLVSDMFKQADALATSDVLAFVSADIILTHRIMEAARLAMKRSTCGTESRLARTASGSSTGRTSTPSRTRRGR